MSKKDFSTKISGSMISYRDLRNCHKMTLKLQDVNVRVSMKGSDALLKYIKAKETFQSN